MSKESTHWLNDRHIILQFLKKLIRDLPELSQKKMTIQSGGVLFEQGMKLESIYLLLEGEVALLRQRGSDKPQEIMRLEPGHFVGLVAFTTSDYSLTRAVATKPSEALCIEKKRVRCLPE